MIQQIKKNAGLLLLITWFLIVHAAVDGQTSLDPAGCDPLTDQELLDMGYEPVRAHGAIGDGITDDTKAIQEAILAANDARRVVYLHPGTYLVSNTLEFKMDTYQTRNNNGSTRYGQMLLGSYCGSEKPTIRLADGIATETNEQSIAAEPFPVILLWRDDPGGTEPDDAKAGRDFNQVVRNLNIILGNNPGAIGIRHNGSEGCSASEVSIDATGGFAGLYNLNGSGGYTYNVEVTGGKYGIYQQIGHGGSVFLTGITLSGQEKTPIATDTWTPMVLVGFDITHDNGQIISSIKGGENNLTVNGIIELTFHDCGMHLFMIDGKITITGGDEPVFRSNNASVYLKNVYFKGQETILARNENNGQLSASNPAAWTLIEEFSYSGPFQSLFGEEGNLINGSKSDLTYFNGTLYPTNEDIIVDQSGDPPADILSRHLYPIALCNVEGSNNLYVTDFGADPNDSQDDTEEIQAAIDSAARAGGMRVFLPASRANASYDLVNKYMISGTLELGEETCLCGVSQYSSVLNSYSWTPSANSPVIRTVMSSSATTKVADFKIEVPKVTGFQPNGDDPNFNPHSFAIHWRAGDSSLFRDVYGHQDFGSRGDRKMIQITDNGGGRWYGIAPLHGSEVPSESVYTDDNGNLKMSPDARHILIKGTNQHLTFYGFHAQHMMPPKGALVEINEASNVAIYGIKSEMGSIPSRMSEIVRNNLPELVPVWMFIKNSDSISLIGHEGLSQTAIGRGLIEITNSTNITVAGMGRRQNGINVTNAEEPQDQWYFVKEDNTTGADKITAQGFLTLFKNDEYGLQVQNHKTRNCSIYPNPASSEVYFSVNGKGNSSYDLRLADMYGRTIVDGQQHISMGNKGELDISFLKPGIYILEITLGNDTFVNKLIKNTRNY